MSNRQGAPPPTQPRIKLIIPQLHDDIIAITHVKNWNSAATELTIENEKYLENDKIENIRNFKQQKKKKTCPKISSAFNYTKTVEHIYTGSIFIKGYPNGKAKK